MSQNTMVSDSLKMARIALQPFMAEAIVDMRFDDKEYSGIGGIIEQEQHSNENGTIFQTLGYVRLIISELPNRLPQSGDVVQVKDANNIEWVARVLTIVRKDEAGASIRVEYGERYD